MTVSVAPETGPLDLLFGRRLTVLADYENLHYSARDLGLQLALSALGSRLRSASRDCRLHAVFSRPPGDDRLVLYCRDRGWEPHPRDIETVATSRGPVRRANADNDLLFLAGAFQTVAAADVLVVASGDGDLVCDIARLARRFAPRRPVLTLSLAGSTSYRLDARRNPDIAGNLEIGRDCLIDPNSAAKPAPAVRPRGRVAYSW